MQRRIVIGGVAGAVAVLVLGLIAISGITFSKTDASNMGCVYNGGPLDSKSFRGYTEPGAGRVYQGLFSTVVEAPVGLRTFRISLDPGQGDTPEPASIKVRVKGINQQYEPTITFTLNTEIRDGKPVVCDFIEKRLRPLGATDFNATNGNWQHGFLVETVLPVVQDVATRVLQKYDPTALAFNTNGERDRAADEFGVELTEALPDVLGDDYFCGPSYQFGGGTGECGAVNVILPEPLMDAADAELIAAPQRAKTEADNAIAVAAEAARKAAGVAAELTKEAASAEEAANAREEIAAQQARVQTAQAAIDYAWCAELVRLGQRCDLVKAAEQADYPDVVTAGDTAIAVTPSTTVPAG